MSEGIIFNIERCSLSDGPGVRTVVFFKGCNLSCAWCHNPESSSFEPQLLHYSLKCVRCGRCLSACQIGALKEDFSPDRSRCLGCGRCAAVCPANAKRISGKLMNVCQVLESILADKPFYVASGGGVTFSGGECMLQTAFLFDLLAVCRENGVSTAVDTAGNVPFEWFEQIDAYTDLYLYDIKCVTPSLHKALTGVDNVLILENYKRLRNLSKDKLIVRIPVIPGYNTVDEELTRIARFLHDFPPARYELIPYHALGNAKRAALGMEAFNSEQPDAKAMEAYEQSFASAYAASCQESIP